MRLARHDSPPPPTIDPAAPLGPDDELLSVFYAAGRLRYGDLGIARDTFAERVVALARRRLGTWGAAADGRGVSEHLQRLAAADLYLTLSCEVGEATGWERLTAEYGPRLTGLAVRRGVDPCAAETHVGELLADLACPPPSRAARTLVGTFDGCGSLFGWLAVILSRRIARANAPAREVPRTSLGSSFGSEESEEREVAASTPGPVEGVVATETAMRLSGVLRDAWNDLTPGESLAVLSKYRDGLEQRQIARLLRVSDSRVSRVVGRAHEKLALAVRRRFAKEGPPDAATWSALCSVVTNHLSSVGAATPPPAVPNPGADSGSAAAGGTP